MLRKLTRAYIHDRKILPINPYGSWNESLLVDEDLANVINLHLQELGNQITASKLVNFLARPEIRNKFGIEKKISERTARRYLKALGYRFDHPKKGMYCDGHEREDVVWYRNHNFIPTILAYLEQTRNYIDGLPEYGPFHIDGKTIILWYHDESIFYANDRRRKSWYHKDAPAKPYTKGEGASLMVADFVSAEFGWLRSKDGTRDARYVMKPGKNRDGYFTSDEIVEQANQAMDICEEDYSEYTHVFIYDNAPSHLKRAEGSLSARKMPKFVPKEGNWLVEVTKRSEDGKPIHNPDGSRQKIKIRMSNGTKSNGEEQSLYFPDDHPQHPGIFKGMANILEERGFSNARKLKAECLRFKCEDPNSHCCCRRILFNQPDFAHVKTITEETFNARGYSIHYLPKFHCELNFIEQCWGYAKRLYRLNPPSSREEQLEKNALEALNAVPLVSMRR